MTSIANYVVDLQLVPNSENSEVKNISISGHVQVFLQLSDNIIQSSNTGSSLPNSYCPIMNIFCSLSDISDIVGVAIINGLVW